MLVIDRRPHRLLIALLAGLSLASCERDGATTAPAELPTAAPASAAGTSPVAATGGESLYLAHCAQCHDGQVLKAPHRTMLGLMTPRAVVAALDSGVMREQGARLDAAQRRELAEYLSGQLLAAAEVPRGQMQCAQGSSEFDFDAPPGANGWGVDLGNRHFYPAEQAGIAAADVPELELKWTFAFPDAIRARSQPVIAGGALYVGSHDGTVYALDQHSGCVRWTFTAAAEVRTGIVVDAWQPGDETARPRLYFGDLIGNVYALDARGGELLWRDRPNDHPSLTITATPSLFEDRLFVALSSLEVTAAADPAYACCTFRGGVQSYEAATGRRGWVAYTIDEAPVQVDVNPRGTPRIAPSGAPIWGAMAIDAERRRIYAGTGENYSSPANARSDAIIAFDLDDGSVAWSWQATAGDAWNMGCESADRSNCPPEDGPDYDFGAAPILLSGRAGPDVILAGQKSGEVHALDAGTGTLLWQRKLGRGGIQGGVHFGMSAEGERLFVPISDYFGGPRWPGEAKPGLYALDAGTGESLWNQPAPDVCAGREFCSPGVSAAIASIPGVVFAGGMDGVLRAHDSGTGALLWEYDTARDFESLFGVPARGGSIGGGAAAVFSAGMMYVSSGYGIYGHMPGNVLLAFGVKQSAAQTGDRK